ncbi:inositol monophosphatase [Candidatus Woesearchaeota archaeon]|nr:inositol monophosphatase [Candidatus Woesearchaeota archaeon]
MVEIKKFMIKTAREAGKIALKMRTKTKIVTIKENPKDFATNADMKCNELIIKKIKKEFPDHGIISEELKEHNKDAKIQWLVDPIDGTLAYSNGHEGYGVMISLMKSNEITNTAIYMPALNEMYYAEKNKGVFMNGQKINCSTEEQIISSTGLLSTKLNKERLNFEKKLYKATKGNIRLNSGYSVCNWITYVASGKVDWIFIPVVNPCPWDSDTVYLLLAEAGCEVTDSKGNKYKAGCGSLVAANPILHRQILKITNEK